MQTKVVCKLLYLTPEKLFSSVKLLKYLKICYENNNLVTIVIDECHCVFEWGTTFRNIYLKLANLKIIFPHIQIILFTATATIEMENK